METTNDCVVNQASSQSQLPGKKGLTTLAKSPKKRNDDSLHKLLQKTTFKPDKNISLARPATCRTPQNLFLEGFTDCASEVIRFLTEDENVDDNNSLLIGLQTHLVNISKTFCHETITDLDRHDAENENKKYGVCAPSTTDQERNHNETVSGSQISLCMMSPIFSRSANSSVSDTSATESDMSMSLSSTSEKIDLSLVSESNFPIDNSNDDHLKVDDVFHSPSARDQSSVSSLRNLSMNALQNKNNQILTLKDDSANNDSLFLAETDHQKSLSPNFLNRHLQSRNYSSPILPESSTQSVTHFEYSHSIHNFPYPTSNIEPNRVTQFPTVSSWNEIFDISTHPSNHNTHYPEARQFQNENSHADAHGTSRRSVPFLSGSNEEPQRDSDFLRQINSVLELTASIQSGTETTENFADILLAVETCRFHEDPRVRALADELVSLIHNDEFEDEDDDVSDDDHIDDEGDNGHSLNEESGVEMLDESSDWGSAVDIFEQ